MNIGDAIAAQKRRISAGESSRKVEEAQYNLELLRELSVHREELRSHRAALEIARSLEWMAGEELRSHREEDAS